MVGVSHDGHTVYKVFKLLGLCHGLRAGSRHRPLGLLEEVCFPRQIGVELRLLLLGIALALKGQADLQGGIILGAGADGGGHAVDGGGEGVGADDVFAVDGFVVGAIALGGVKGQLDVDEIGRACAEGIAVVGLDVVALPLGVQDAGAVGEQVDVAAFHGFDGDLGLHLVGVARLRQVDDEVDALEPCRRGEGRGRQQGERQSETEQRAEQFLFHGSLL